MATLSHDIWDKVEALCCNKKDLSGVGEPKMAHAWALLLGLDADPAHATTAAMKERFRKDLALRFHPDKVRGAEEQQRVRPWWDVIQTVYKAHVAPGDDRKLRAEIRANSDSGVLEWVGETPSSVASIFAFARAVLGACGLSSHLIGYFDQAGVFYRAAVRKINCAHHAAAVVQQLAAVVAQKVARVLRGQAGGDWVPVPQHPLAACNPHWYTHFQPLLDWPSSPVDHGAMADLTLAALAHPDRLPTLEADAKNLAEARALFRSWRSSASLFTARYNLATVREFDDWCAACVPPVVLAAQPWRVPPAAVAVSPPAAPAPALLPPGADQHKRKRQPERERVMDPEADVEMTSATESSSGNSKAGANVAESKGEFDTIEIGGALAAANGQRRTLLRAKRPVPNPGGQKCQPDAGGGGGDEPMMMPSSPAAGARLTKRARTNGWVSSVAQEPGQTVFFGLADVCVWSS